MCSSFFQMKRMQAKPRRILIVDDDPDIVANLSDILTDIGHRTVTACNGSRALEQIKSNCNSDDCRFDLCLLDFKMPGMDGIELYEKIRQKIPSLRAIMITAYAGDDGVARALQAGTWRVIRKPVDVKVLLGMIDEAIASDMKS